MTLPNRRNCLCTLPALGKSEFGVCGGVGGMMVIELLAGTMRLDRDRIAAVVGVRRTSQKWYNMQYINMSGKLPMGIAGNAPRVRCSAAYPTGRERIAKGLLYHGVLYPEALVKETCELLHSSTSQQAVGGGGEG